MKDEKLFNERVDEFAVKKVERKEQGANLARAAKLAKAFVGMSSSEYRRLSATIYSTTPAAKELAEKAGKKATSKLEKVADQFAELYSQLVLLGEGERMERLLANRGVKVEAAVEGILTEKYQGKKKVNDGLAELWDEVIGGEIPREPSERAKVLVQSGVACLNDIANIDAEMSSEILEEAADDCGVVKAHLSKAINLRYKAISKGEDVISEAVDQITADTEQLVDTLNALIPGEKE